MSRYKDNLKLLGKVSKEMLELHLWVLSYFLMMKSQGDTEMKNVASDIIDKYHSYRTLQEYDALIGKYLEGT